MFDVELPPGVDPEGLRLLVPPHGFVLAWTPSVARQAGVEILRTDDMSFICHGGPRYQENLARALGLPSVVSQGSSENARTVQALAPASVDGSEPGHWARPVSAPASTDGSEPETWEQSASVEPSAAGRTRRARTR